MAIASVKEIHDGRDGGVTMSLDGKTVKQYTRIWRVITTSPYDNAAIILRDSRFKIVGATYPGDGLAFARSVRPRQSGRTKLVWLVTATYSTERKIVVNPLMDPADITWSTDSRTKAFYKDKDGKAILNAAGFYFDPPVEDDDSRWIATVKKNVDGAPSWFIGSRNAINDRIFYLDGWKLGKWWAKMMGITIGSWQERNDIAYRVLTMRIAVDEDSWIKETLNDGFYELKTPGADPTHILDADGDPVTSPWPLDEAGKMIAKPTPDNATFISSKTCKERNFKELPLV